MLNVDDSLVEGPTIYVLNARRLMEIHIVMIMKSHFSSLLTIFLIEKLFQFLSTSAVTFIIRYIDLGIHYMHT